MLIVVASCESARKTSFSIICRDHEMFILGCFMNNWHEIIFLLLLNKTYRVYYLSAHDINKTNYVHEVNDYSKENKVMETEI